MKIKRLKQLKDNDRFQFNKRGVIYMLLKKDRKTKTATYQSQNSNRTFETDWNGQCIFLFDYSED